MFSRPLKEGDALVGTGCAELVVLGVCGSIVFSHIKGFEEVETDTIKSLYELGYRLLEDKKPWVPREEKDEIFHLYFSPATVGVGIATTFLRKGDTEWNAKFLESNNYFRTAAEAILASDKVKELLKSIKEG